MSLVLQNLRAQPSPDFTLQIESLRVAPGEIVGVMGKSGSGKSTLLTALGGFLPEASGRVEIEGQDRSAFAPERRRLAYVFQKNTLFPHLTLEKNVAFPLEVAGKKVGEWRDPVQRWLDRFGLSALKDRLPHEVSGGEAQRAALARALVSGFQVLLFDEPFSALDPKLRRDLRALVKEVVAEKGLSGLWVTHDLEDVALFSRVLVLEGGRVAWTGPAAELPRDLYF